MNWRDYAHAHVLRWRCTAPIRAAVGHDRFAALFLLELATNALGIAIRRLAIACCTREAKRCAIASARSARPPAAGRRPSWRETLNTSYAVRSLHMRPSRNS